MRKGVSTEFRKNNRTRLDRVDGRTQVANPKRIIKTKTEKQSAARFKFRLTDATRIVRIRLLFQRYIRLTENVPSFYRRLHWRGGNRPTSADKTPRRRVFVFFFFGHSAYRRRPNARGHFQRPYSTRRFRGFSRHRERAHPSSGPTNNNIVSVDRRRFSTIFIFRPLAVER